MKILVTGGHLTPALSFIDFVQKKHSRDKIVFVGREFSQDALQQKAVERYEVEKRNIPFVVLEAVRFGSSSLSRPIQSMQQFISSIKAARKILEKHMPSVVMSFGGYMAVPVAIAAWRMKIPVVTHEQTITSGFANRCIGLLAKKVAVSFPESQAEFPAGKTVVTGNPLRAGVFQFRHPKPDWLPAKLSKPLLLITGGNQGSQAINEAIAQALPELTKDWVVVHQCGRPTAAQPYLELLTRHRRRLPKKQQQRYFIKEWIDESDLFWLYRHAFCVISRAGANATQEIAASEVPAILIPLPSARNDEQYHNARWLVESGGAVLLEQSALKTSTLLKSLETVKTLESAMRNSLAEIRLPKNAAEQLYELVSAAASS